MAIFRGFNYRYLVRTKCGTAVFNWNLVCTYMTCNYIWSRIVEVKPFFFVTQCSWKKKYIYTMIFVSNSHLAAYHTGKVNPVRESKAPAYSFGLKTSLLQTKSTTPSPNSYTLPSLIGSSIVCKRSNAAYSITGRSKIGSFHEDLQKVGDTSTCIMKCHNGQPP